MTVRINQNEEELEQCLFDALLGLMEKTPIDKLSVNDILDHAHVSRSSFYRRYHDKYDLLNKSYSKILSKTLYTVLEGETWSYSFVSIYEVIRQHLRFFQNALSSQDPNSLKNYIYQISLKLYLEILKRNGEDIEDEHTVALIRIHIWGNLEMMCEWIMGGMQWSIAEMMALSYESLPARFQPYFDIEGQTEPVVS